MAFRCEGSKPNSAATLALQGLFGVSASLVSRLRIAAPFAAGSHGNPEAEGHEKVRCARAVYVPQMPLRASREFGRHLQDTARAMRKTSDEC
jgi:hypothetical protein